MVMRISLLVACLYSIWASCSALIPLIGWSNSDAFTSVKGSQFTNANEFIYDASLDDIDMVVIFKTPELSFDSLAKYGGVFGGKNPTMASLQAELKGSKSSAWVGVDGSVASDLVRTLSFVMGVEPHIITGADGLTKGHKLVQVELFSGPDTDSFSEQDDVISEVMSALHALLQSQSFAAIYTSSHTHLPRPSHKEPEVRRRRNVEEYEYNRVPRAVNQDPSSTEPQCASLSNYNNSTQDNSLCMLFCFTDIIEVSRNGTEENEVENFAMEITNLTFVDGSCLEDTEVCGGENSSACLIVSAQVNDTGVLEPVNFTFAFPNGRCESGGDRNVSCGFWTMELYVNDIPYMRATEEVKIFSDFLVPIGTSYACGDNRLNVYKPRTNETTDEYKFFGLQVQLFSGISYDRNGLPVFGSVFNCQGYLTTIPLMGLAAVIVLLLILYCSVVFLFSIKTQDRFDDPRGPTISVENLH